MKQMFDQWANLSSFNYNISKVPVVQLILRRQKRTVCSLFLCLTGWEFSLLVHNSAVLVMFTNCLAFFWFLCGELYTNSKGRMRFKYVRIDFSPLHVKFRTASVHWCQIWNFYIFGATQKKESLKYSASNAQSSMTVLTLNSFWSLGWPVTIILALLYRQLTSP